MRLIPLILMTVLAAAASPADEAIEAYRLKAVLEHLGVEAAPSSLPPAPIPGFLEVVRGMQVLYVSADGDLVVDGDILSLASETNLTEKRRASLRRDMLRRIPEDQRVVLHTSGPPKARIVVFTDINCPYCLLLHRQHEKLLEQGIEIQYLFYPRSGRSGKTWSQAIAVWCSTNRLQALDAALNGETLPAAECRHPVAAHYELARQLDLRGTPAMITPDGELRYGVTSVDEILHAIGVPSHGSSSS